MNSNYLSISDFCITGSGTTPSRKTDSYYHNGIIPWVKSGELRENIIYDTEEYVTEQALIDTSLKLIPKGSLLIAMYGATVGRLAILGIEATTNQAICHIIPDPEIACALYLFHYLKYKVPYLIAIAQGGAQPNISQEIIKRQVIPLPPLPEQKRIAVILEKVGELRQKRRRSLALLDDLLRSVFLDMFGDPITNQKGWNKKTVETFCNLVRGSSPRPKGDPRYFGGPIPRLMVADLTRDGFFVTPRIDSLTEEGAKKSRPTQKGSVVMAVSGNVGLTAILENDACIHDGFVGFHDLDQEIVSAKYLMFCLHLMKQTHDTRKDGAIFQNLTTKGIKSMEIPVPPRDLQEKWEANLNRIFHEKALHLKSHETLDQLFFSLQANFFNGN